MSEPECLFGGLPEQIGPARPEPPPPAPRLREAQRDQIALRVVDLEGLLPPDHPARAVWAFVEQLDLSPLLDAIKKIVTEETAANARLAEQEWERVTPAYARGKFTAAPSIAVRPSALGLVIYVRYITRANERQEVRARLYQAVVELMHKRNMPEAAAVQQSARTV